MPDLLVNLFKIPPVENTPAEEFLIRRAQPFELTPIRIFVTTNFSQSWAELWALREMGYVYAVIGAAGPVRFYQKTVGAIIIPDSEPGIYTDFLKSADSREQ